MHTGDTSDALDMTKENIKPLKQGRKPVQLETALQAQSSVQIQQKLNNEKKIYEQAICTYEGDDPLAPRFEYIKWLEQMYFKSGPESNILNVLMEETVQKFKNDLKYKQDPRFVQILINFIENQPNAVELYQTVYNQGLGTQCALFYRAWADLLDRHNDFKRVDQIFIMGIQHNAKPVEELEQAHVQFQLSIARRMLNGQLSNEKVDEKRQALNVLKKHEARSGVRHGSKPSASKSLQPSSANEVVSTINVFEDNNENELLRAANNIDCDLAPKGLNKENTVKPGPWTKPKKDRSTVPKPVSTVNFEVHQDNVEPVTKLHGIKVPNALRSRKGNSNLNCPVAIFGPHDPFTMVMYCKEKVYAAGRDVQLEEIRAEMYFNKEKGTANCKDINSMQVCNKAESPNKVILPEEKSNTNDFKVPSQTRVESDPSESVTVNTKVAIHLVQQMWNSPTADKPEKVNSKCSKSVAFNEFEKPKTNDMKRPSDFKIYEDNETPTKKDNNEEDIQIKQRKTEKSTTDVNVYLDENDQSKKHQSLNVYIDNDIESINTSIAYTDKNCKNKLTSSKIPKVFEDNENEKNTKIQNYQVEKNVGKQTNVITDIDENKSPFKKIPSINENDDLTCSTKAFTCLLSSSTPLAFRGTKSKMVNENQLQSLRITQDNEIKEIDEFPLGKSLSMILEASKERNSSSSSGINSVVSSIIKPEQQSKIDFGDVINPHDEVLISKLLQKVVKFPNKHHLSGYIEYDTDVPNMRSEFKLGNDKLAFLGTLGKGSYARVVKAQVDDKSVPEKALKIQKPACVWEWYICKEIQHRLQDSDKILYFVNMENMYIFKNGSIISMELSVYGTLLSVIQNYKKRMNRSIPTSIAALLSLQITSALKFLHECQIIHSDLKPDNIVVKSLPNESSQPCVQLIDFGRSIDMTLFPQDTVFTHTVKTADFVCHEMREKLPWTYQTDYYGLAGIIYIILMSDYMQTQKIRKIWVLTKPLPRYIEADPWANILSMLLNIESCNNLPNLNEIIDKLSKYYSNQQKIVLTHHLNSIKNVLTNN